MTSCVAAGCAATVGLIVTRTCCASGVDRERRVAEHFSFRLPTTTRLSLTGWRWAWSGDWLCRWGRAAGGHCGRLRCWRDRDGGYPGCNSHWRDRGHWCRARTATHDGLLLCLPRGGLGFRRTLHGRYNICTSRGRRERELWRSCQIEVAVQILVGRGRVAASSDANESNDSHGCRSQSELSMHGLVALDGGTSRAECRRQPYNLIPRGSTCEPPGATASSSSYSVVDSSTSPPIMIGGCSMNSAMFRLTQAAARVTDS